MSHRTLAPFTLPLLLAGALALWVPGVTRAGADLDSLKVRYLACDHDASQRRLSSPEAAACSQVSEQLLREGFDSDLERMLRWWRSARPSAAVTDALFEHARSQYEAGHYAQAFASFARLADEGHAEAARIALQMRQFGPRLYGMNFTAGPRQLVRWRALQSRDGAPSGTAGKPNPAGQGRAQPPVPNDHFELWRHQGVG